MCIYTYGKETLTANQNPSELTRQFLSTLAEREKQIERDALYTVYKNVGRGYNAIQIDFYNLTLNTFHLIWFSFLYCSL